VNIKKDRIIHVVPTLGAGGTEKNCARLIRAFNETGKLENIVVATRQGDGAFETVFQELSSYPIVLLPTQRYASFRQFQHVIRENCPKAVLFHFLNIDQVFLALAARISGVSRIVTSAGTAAIGSPSYLRKLQVILLGNLILKCPIVSASNWIKTTHESLMRLPKDSSVVHNGVEIDQTVRAGDERFLSRKPDEALTIGIVSRLDAVKEHDVLIRGFAQFLEDIPEARAELRIIGDGPRRQALEGLTRQLGVSDRVIYLGNRLDIEEQLAALDLFVFATKKKEGFGNVLIEALAAGIPIIANDVPSSNEVLRGGKFGTIIPCTGSEAWADAIAAYWREGPGVPPPGAKEVEAAYGIERFRDGYLAALGFQP